jgi:predicted permease
MRGSLLDFVHAWRLLLKSPGFTLLAMLCLALGIGVNTSIFSLLNFLYLRPLPVGAPDRLLVLSRGGNPLISYPDYRDLRDRSRWLEGMAISNPTESSLDFDGQSHAAAAEAVSLSYARVIGVRAYLGRWFEREDEQTAVISFRTWQRLFHGDPNILGKRVRSETQWYTIVGVAPREFAGIYLPLNMDLWVPFQTWARQYPDRVAGLEDRTRPQVFVFGRLKPGIEMSQATAELNAIAVQMQTERPRNEAKPMPLVAERVRGVPNVQSRKAAVPLSIVLMAVVGMVLLIACVNVGNLLLARGAAREREISTRIALGAGRARIVRQLLTESLLLAAGGGLLGFVLGAWSSRWFETILPTTAFGESLRLDLAPDLRVAIFSAALALLTTLLFGLTPAWRASRTDVIRRLKGDASSARFRLRSISLTGQVSVSLVLLLTAGLFLRVLLAFQTSDPGFAVNNRLYVTAYVSAPEFTPETGRRFYAQTLERLRSLPGVKSAAITDLLPLTPIRPGCASEFGTDIIPATTSAIGSGYLQTMRIPLLAGRDFSTGDRPDGPPVAIVNEALARRLWPGHSPIGKHVLLGCHGASSFEVVGVARDTRFVSLGELPQPHVYRPFSQNYGGLETIVVEITSNAGAMLETVRKAIAPLSAGNAGVRIYGVAALSEWVSRSYWQVRWEASMLGAFGCLALLLAAVGLYGVVAYHVTLRTREIGIRMAVGARPADVLRLILRQGLSCALVGVGIGLLASMGLARVIGRLLYGVSPTDLPTYAAVSVLWLSVALTACYLPARRAARVDPTVTLRYE